MEAVPWQRVGVAAHECGHAIQDAIGYAPLKVRSALVPAANFGAQLSWPLFIFGLIFSLRPLLMGGYHPVLRGSAVSGGHAAGGV